MSKFLRYRDLEARGIVKNRMTLKRWMDAQAFPRPYRLGPNSVAWKESEIEEWAQQRRAGAPLAAA